MANILYAEDDALSRRLVTRILGNKHDVTVVANGLDAIKEAGKKDFDLILLDINLGDGDASLRGTDVAVKLRRDGYTGPIIAVSAVSGEKHISRAKAAGCSDFIAKPIQAQNFLSIVGKYLSNAGKNAHLREVKRPTTDPLTDYTNDVVERLTRKVEALSRLDTAKTEFLTLISHELRTPLTLIVGYTKLIRSTADNQEMSLPTDMIMMLDNLELAVQRLNAFIERTVLYMRILNGTLADNMIRERVHLDEVVRSVLENFVSTSTRIHISHSLNSAIIYGDKTLLQKIVIILLENSIANTPDGGTIHISTSQQGSWGKLQIQDTGRGIPKELQKNIFEPFVVGGDMNLHSSKGAVIKYGQQGTGLGLAILKGVVKYHGGKIHLRSEPGNTVFGIYIPSDNSFIKEGALPNTGQLISIV